MIRSQAKSIFKKLGTPKVTQLFACIRQRELAATSNLAYLNSSHTFTLSGDVHPSANRYDECILIKPVNREVQKCTLGIFWQVLPH